MTPQSPAPVAGRPLTAEDVEIIRDYWSAYADADWHLIPEAIRDDFDARLVAVGLAEWRAVTADDLDDAFAHDRGLEAGGSCLDLTALGYLAFKADADGWMPWSGGENPVPGQMVDWKARNGVSESCSSDDLHGWNHPHESGSRYDIIAFRLSRPASEQPVEAIGAGREEIAKCIIGPRNSVPAGSRWTLDELRQVRWDAASDAERKDALWAADAILAALSPASPAQEDAEDGYGPDPHHTKETSEDKRLMAAGYKVCGSGANTQWHWMEPNGVWHDHDERGRCYRQEHVAAKAALAHLAGNTPPASPARTPMGEPQVLKGVGKINGDGWKDTTSIGEVVYVWNAEKPSPYAPGQYPRIDNEGWSASTAQYDFSPASVDEVRALAAPTPMGGDREHSSRCWGRTSFSDEVLHCYCQTAPTPMGGEVEALREALEPFAAVADEYDDREDDTFEVWMDAGPVMVRDIRKALRLSAFRRARQALAPSSPSPAQGGDAEDEDDPELPDTSLARTIYKHFCDVHMLNPDEAADATGELLAAIAAPDEAMCSEHRPAADEDQVREWALIGLYLVEGRTTTDSESSMSIEWALGDRAALLADAEGWALEDAREDYNRIFCDRTNALSASPQPEAGEASEDDRAQAWLLRHYRQKAEQAGFGSLAEMMHAAAPPSVQPVEGK